MKITTCITTTILTATLGLASWSQAAVIATETGSLSAFTVSTTDLAQTNLDNLDASALTWATWGGDLTDVNDGVSTTGAADYLFVTEGTMVFNLDLTASAGGYEITQIDTFTGNTDFNRVQQDYTVSYATVAAPTTWVDIATIASATVAGKNESKWSITENVTGILATNVAAIRFVLPTQQLGGVQYKEIDIIGTAIPEPGTYALIAGLLGLSSVMLRRRR